MKRLLTLLLVGTVFLAAAILCFSFGDIDGGENIIVQYPDTSVPLRSAFISTEGFIELLPGETVNINTADLSELMKLPEIGEVIAQRIIDYRQEHGPFSSIEEIKEVEDIGQFRFESIRSLIVTGNER